MENKDWKQDDTFLARWMADEVTPEEREAFEASEDGQYYISLKKASNNLKAPVYDLNGEWSRLQTTHSQEKKASTQIWFNPTIKWSVAASFILLIGAFFLLSGSKTIRAGFGEQQLAKLPDGSEVRLNSGSVFSYNKWDWIWSRKVTLEEGEAFFQVTKGNRFQVATTEGTVNVLGTSFNVNVRNNKFRVACYTGKVEVESGDVNQVLGAGMAVVLSAGEMVDMEAAGVVNAPSWTKGIVRLKKVTFKEVLESLERTFNIEIDNQDASLDTLKFTGAYPNNPETALKLVLEPLNISYSFETNKRKLTIIGRNE